MKLDNNSVRLAPPVKRATPQELPHRTRASTALPESTLQTLVSSLAMIAIPASTTNTQTLRRCPTVSGVKLATSPKKLEPKSAPRALKERTST